MLPIFQETGKYVRNYTTLSELFRIDMGIAEFRHNVNAGVTRLVSEILFVNETCFSGECLKLVQDRSVSRPIQCITQQ